MKDCCDNTPIACSLTTVELRDREATLLAEFRSRVIEIEELEEGYAFRLPSNGKWIGLIAELIMAERECCPFLAFELAVLPKYGTNDCSGEWSSRTKEFLRTVLMQA